MNVRQKSGITIGAIIVTFSLMTSISIARAEILSDFTSDVQRGLQAGAPSSTVTSIKTQDYKTSWDEFGTNVLVDGTSAPTEIQRSLADDIVISLQTELTYNQKDEQYLRLRQSSPEEILALEGDSGGDLLPENYIEPNPSLDANPDVNPSTLDMPISALDMSSVLTTPEGEWKPADITVFETIVNAEPPADIPSEPSPDTTPDTTPPTDTSPSL